MKILEILKSGYVPSERPLEYPDKHEVWDKLIADNGKIQEVLSLRNQILEISENYIIPPKTAFGSNEKQNLVYLISSLKFYFDKHKNVQIMQLIIEIENYLKSMD